MGRMNELSLDLFTYPNRPGFTNPTTSRAAAASMVPVAETLRDHVLAHLRATPSTVHETAEVLGKPVPAVQPRFSELFAHNPPLIEDTGIRRANKSGRKAAVWRAR